MPNSLIQVARDFTSGYLEVIIFRTTIGFGQIMTLLLTETGKMVGLFQKFYEHNKF